MLTERLIALLIICITVVLICLIGSVCDVIKQKGSKDNERKNDDRL